jgi:hypothetical protein
VFDIEGYDFNAALARIVAERRMSARALCADGEETGTGFRRLTHRRSTADERQRARSIRAARSLQDIAEIEEDLDLIGRAGDALY